MDLEQAVQKHSEWKIRFRTAISKQETMDAANVSKDNCCDLGKWLHGEGKSMFGNLASLSECITRHAAFHIEAGKVASAINMKKYAEAEKMIAIQTPYAAASTAVTGAILKLKKEARL
jgi:hypothetical protein